MLKELEVKELVRSLPKNIEAEQMLLGAILINHELLNQVIEFLHSLHFSEPIHQEIYKAILVAIEKGMNPNPIIIKTILDKIPIFKELGGLQYLQKIATIATMVINPVDYGRLIHDLAVKRSLIQIGEDLVNKSYDTSIELSANENIEIAESKLYNLTSQGVGERTFVKVKDSISESIETIHRAMKNSDHVTGISSGLIDLDTKLSGFHNSDLIILAARPGMGKSAFALNFALSACKSMKEKNKDPKIIPSVGVFALEMSSEQLASRLLSIYTSIDGSSLRSGKMSEEEYNSLRKAAVELGNLPLFIDDSPALTLSAVRTRSRRLKRKHDLGLIIIDYLQLLKSNTRTDNRVLEISEITQGLKALAKELNIPIIALAQLSRAVEQRIDKRPLLSDLRESGSIEQDADVVMFLYREEYYLFGSEPQSGTEKHTEWQEKLDKVHNVTDVIISKHRHGPTGNVRVYYDTKYSKVSNYQHVK